MFTIEQQGSQWIVRNAAGDQVGDAHATYELALGAIAGELATVLAAQADDSGGDGEGATSSTGTLPERWHSTTGVAFQERLAEETPRDFTSCEWSFRDASVYPLPLMDQTCMDVGHFGAELAGFCDTNAVDGGTVYMSGGFYDSEAGRAMRDRMLSGNRQGVSVDPGELDVEFVCTEQDDDGWCNAGEYQFLAYQIIGLTGTPFPGFSNATIELEGATPPAPAPEADAAASRTAAEQATRPTTVAASAGRLAAPIAPPVAWFQEPEPQVGDPRLIEQPDGSLACPLTITNDGQVYGHMARWGQCHVGNPEGPDVCVTPPETPNYDASFNLAHVVCEGGEDVTTGPLISGCEHPSTRLRAGQIRDYMAHNGVAWADVHVTHGEFGPWCAGALRPDVTELQLRVLRASSLSGQWAEVDEYPGAASLIAGLAVSTPGFPITRHALAASGMTVATQVQPRARVVNGVVLGLVASGIVQPCPDCARRAQLARSATGSPRGGTPTDRMLAEILRSLNVLDRRTAHLRGPAAEHLAARVRRT